MEIIEHKFRNTTYRVFVTPGQRVEIHTHEHGNLVNVRVFQVGDQAEYDSYNLSYYAPIKKITKKNAIFEVYGRRKMVKWETFAWRNYDFNLNKARENNSETMNYI